MTREQVNKLTDELGMYVRTCMPPRVHFALIVVDEETGKSSMVSDMGDEAVHELTAMIVERGRDVTLNRKRGT